MAHGGWVSRWALGALLVGFGCHGSKATPSGSAPVPAASGSAPAKARSASVSSASPEANAFYAERYSKHPLPGPMTELGRKLFFDPALSGSGKMSCATCHDPRFAYGPPNALAAQLGGPDLTSPGVRAVPALRYLQTVPRFSEHYFDEAGDESVDQGPTGGHAWDGRADTLHDQARVPLTSPFEMANASVSAVVQKVESADYAKNFRDVFGGDVFADAARAESAVLLVLEIFQQSPQDFYPYSSRYDAWLRRKGSLSAQEERGRKAFEDPNKGNCAHCHPSGIRAGAFPQFTDFGYAALGLPRNAELPANREPSYFDLGLCGPLRTDLSQHREYCGSFRVPSLRNVALRRTFFHNGVFHQLEDAVRFYAERDTKPRSFYKSAAYDDLPPDVRKNVNQEPPFGRKPGQPPALSGAEIADIVAFLGTLTDADLAPQAAGP